MGKKGRKTRWRTLTITDEHSDSEESNTTTSGHRVSKGYQPQKSYYGRFTYSSQSTPTRRYQCDGTKSTRSSSTASENKITFNEDEYTRITTPRQDVLFKKGYLNKPKTYQTQTSTGNSTTSTGNSTGNGTPDHQSTDLEYESQFVFPNGFVDQNGIYYVNSFEPYPVMVFNPPTYYSDFTNIKSKRCSTGSLTESTSPNNEETSQDLSQSETPNNVSDFNRVYNVIYPGFYFNGACQPQDVANHNQPEPRRMKKKRRRKLSRSKSVQEATTSEYTDESSDEVFSDHQQSKEEERTSEEEKKDVDEPFANGLSKEESEEEEEEEKVVEKPKYDLKPDAEEFVPRAYRQPETIPMEPNVQFIKIPSNFVPLPILNHHPLAAEFNGQNFNAFIPPGIPINFIPQNYVNYIPNSYVNKTENGEEEKKQTVEAEKREEKKTEEKAKETVEVPKSNNHIDIAKIVWKLEEAAKEQDHDEKCKEEEETTNEKTKKINNPGRNIKRTRYQKVDAKPPEDEKPEIQKTVWKPSPKKEPPPPTKTFVRNYSETLKKSTVMTQCERHEKHMERQKINKIASTKEVVVVKNHMRVVEPIQKTPDQWISVSNRKKRKNKNIEDVEEVVENGVVGEEEATETVIAEPEMPPPLPPPPPPEPEPKIVNPIKIEETPIVVDAKQEVTKEDKTKPSTKKKSKKNGNNNNQKPLTKRVIIKDADLVQEVEKTVVNKEEKPVVEEAKEVKEEPLKGTEDVEEEESIQEPVVDEEKPAETTVTEEKCIVEEEKKETPEKKSKKKKKKIQKPTVLTSSRSSSSTTLNVIDDSYDFLLETSILDESSREKTNVEVSQELDKMIQRGMYSSLEEKIKRLNIESSDNFFKTVIHNISRESSVENNYGKSPDLSKLLNSTSHLHLKSTNNNKMELKKLGDFLGEGTPKTVVGGDEKSNAENTKPDEELYPITKAVKEWMTKTRETTPDVEIFKSPSAIFREFNGAEENSLSAVDGGDEEEVTLYSNDDLLDYWEDPVPEGEAKKTSSSSLEEGEEVLEEYQSKYGMNEDYLRIKKEVEESRGGLPKHGNLPYRAICCSIM